ncbi:antitoxin VbhA family protein (plasmid) [Iamia sp. SCSIO 61187]|uniref:antitoxin VbhA family protein n=1 Tax=Iamia sp. SCSIO 61187 TaxID=2722752 RepID=UPI001C62AA0C|nr:antitoxin VbhA family protein [Iamia sp. SCSIO 61187]QYG94387.1 antitoxin VbhA family protein [Iamia sp. SCSIO 61187]QYG95800.1 antitoxin VbhA family protein [Iamia sp. SCSIO 61187]
MVTDPSAHAWSQRTDTTPASFRVAGWRYLGVDVAYEQSTVIGGGPLMFSALAGASMVGNRRRRDEAGRLAAPRWRPLGDITVVFDDARLLVHHEGAWASVWLDAITMLQGHPGGAGVTLLFADDPPYAFTGAWAGHLAAAIERALAARRAPAGTSVAEGDEPRRSRLVPMGQDPSVRSAVASARLEGVELEPAVVAILEAAAAGEMTSDQARRKILAEHGVDLPTEHRLSQPAHAN